LYDRLPWSASLLLRGYRKYHLGPISAAWEVGRTIPLGLAIKHLNIWGQGKIYWEIGAREINITLTPIIALH